MKNLLILMSFLVISCQGSKGSKNVDPTQQTGDSEESIENSERAEENSEKGMDLNLVFTAKEANESCAGLDFNMPEAASEQMQTYVFRLGLINSDHFKGKSLDEIEQWFQSCIRTRFK
ncbi:MAG: hypothetical protein KBD78_08995 [Oligoflexales bacterium]|nr:hypothetical protein [Oligoflexales bacterium]